MSNWKKLLTRDIIADLTYGDRDSDSYKAFANNYQVIYAINKVSERWMKWLEDVQPTPTNSKEKTEVLQALTCVVEDIEMLQDGTWEPDEHSCMATMDNLKIVIDYIEKTKGE